jgi:hypothetical protein
MIPRDFKGVGSSLRQKMKWQLDIMAQHYFLLFSFAGNDQKEMGDRQYYVP